MSALEHLPTELVAGLDVHAAAPVAGGAIARAYRLQTADGRLFLKCHPNPKPHLFEREAAGPPSVRSTTA